MGCRTTVPGFFALALDQPCGLGLLLLRLGRHRGRRVPRYHRLRSLHLGPHYISFHNKAHRFLVNHTWNLKTTMTFSESRKCKEFLDAMFHQLSQPYLTSTKACVYIKADKEMVANIAKCFARAGLLNVELAKRTKGYYFDLPSSPTRRELKNKRCSCGHNSTRPHQLEPRHWWDFAKLFPFAYGPNGLLTSMWIGLKSAIKIWMGIRSKSTLPALSWTSWRPTGRNGALSSRTLCLLQFFLLTSVILSYYVSRATYVDQA